MTDLTQGINQWVRWIPNYQQRLVDGSIFNNYKASPKDRISMEIRILNHSMRSDYLAMIKNIQNISQVNEFTAESRRQIIEENVRNIENLFDGGRPIKSGEEFYKTQTDDFITLAESTIMADCPLLPNKLDDEGNEVEGDEKNLEGSSDIST